MGILCWRAMNRSSQTLKSIYTTIPTAITVGMTTALIFRYMNLPPQPQDRRTHLKNIINFHCCPFTGPPAYRKLTYASTFTLRADENFSIPEPVVGVYGSCLLYTSPSPRDG